MLALGTVVFFGCLLGVGAWINHTIAPTLPPKEGFAYFYYRYGDFAGWGAALLAFSMVAYSVLVAVGAIPMVWVRQYKDGVRLASPWGRVGLRSRSLAVGTRLGARLFNDGRTPEYRVLDLASRGKMLRVGCFSPIAEERMAAFAAMLREYGVDVTLTDDLFDP